MFDDYNKSWSRVFWEGFATTSQGTFLTVLTSITGPAMTSKPEKPLGLELLKLKKDLKRGFSASLVCGGIVYILYDVVPHLTAPSNLEDQFFY